MSELLPLTLAVRSSTVVTLWFTLIGSGGATLFPDLVLAQGIFADSFIDRSTVRLIAVPLFIACVILLTDYYYGWSRGMLL
jgi:hypothetical protein